MFKNIIKLFVAVFAMGSAYAYGDAETKRLEAKCGDDPIITDDEYVPTLVKVLTVSYLMGLTARLIIKRIG